MRRMKHIELTVLSRDIDRVIEFLGQRALMHLSDKEEGQNSRAIDEASLKHIRENLDRLSTAAAYLVVQLPAEPYESSRFPGETEEVLANTIINVVSTLSRSENEQRDEKRKVEEALTEAKAFANLNAPFSDLDQLSYLTLRVGRLDSRRQDELKQSLSDRAVIIPLGSDDGNSGGRILAAASRKGRFALDSELKRAGFVPISIPEGYKGIPSELLSGLDEKLKKIDQELKAINGRKEKLKEEYGVNLQFLTASFLMAGLAEQLKARLVATKNVYLLSGWIPTESVDLLVTELSKITEDRIAVRSFNPTEIKGVVEGKEKVPVSLKHNAFVRGFETLVFSYGAPLYGTLDPTPLVAIFFTVLFGIMFGDLGQGMVLVLLGFLTGRQGTSFFSKFKKFSVPLKAVGVSSMVMGFLSGSFFTNEEFLIGPTRALTKLITGQPMDRILTIMPLAEKGGSVQKLFYFFGFTIAVGALLNSAGLILNTINQFSLKKYEKAIFSKTGLAGILFFWYALFIAVRFVLSISMPASFTFNYYWFDTLILLLPVAGIFMGRMIWRLISGEKPYFEEGFLVYFMEGFVEILETVSIYISNSVSFLRVGAFALSHAVLSFIVFRFFEEVSSVSAGGALSAAAAGLILVSGNVIIILLEGLIVAIQVVRLQYYEFFSKFFTEMGVEFSPFRFRKEKNES